MKKKTLLFTLCAGLVYLSMSSNRVGPIGSASGAGNCTGSPGATNPSCAKSGCHDASPATIIDSIVIRDKATNAIVSSYSPGKAYKIALCGHNSNLLSNFGFQACMLDNANNTNAGTLVAGTNMAVRTAASIKVVEHTTALAGTGIVLRAEFEWTGANAGTGPVTLYTVMNAVNNNMLVNGDAVGVNVNKILTENLGVNDLDNTISINTYPNPVVNSLTIKMENASPGAYTLQAFDITGRIISEEVLTVNGTTHQSTINTYTWANGTYQLRISKDGQAHTLPVVKQ